MFRLLVVVLLASLALPASAQEDPKACATLSGDTERLACYDALFRTPADTPDVAEVVLESKQLIPARPTGSRPATMTVACNDGALSVAFSFAGQVLSETSDEAAITFQVQQAGNRVRSLPVSDDNMSIGFARSSEADAFLETLEGGKNLFVRITPVRQRSVQVQFDVGSREADISALREACR